MTPNRRFEWNEGPDDELRGLLREWKAPEPPAQLERALVWRLRRRSAWKRWAPWLAAAACLALVLLGRLTSAPTAPPPRGPGARDAAREATPPAAAAPLAAASASRPAGATAPGASSEGPSESGAATASQVGRASTAKAEDPVLVEPGQAELLAELARALRGARQSPPGAPLPPIEVIPAHSTPPIESSADVELQPYQLHWESVGGEWPSMRRAL
jgi:hypothetical protein